MGYIIGSWVVAYIIILCLLASAIQLYAKRETKKYISVVKLFVAMATHHTQTQLSVLAYEQIYQYFSGVKFGLPLHRHLSGLSRRVNLMLRWVDSVKNIVNSPVNSSLIIDEVAEKFSYPERLSIMVRLFLIASVDSKITPDEAELIDRYVQRAAILYRDYMNIKSRYAHLYQSEDERARKEEKTSEKGREESRNTNRKKQANRKKQENRKQQNNKRQKADTPKEELNVNKQWAYQVLGIPSSSSDEVVRSAYRRLSMQYHPDKHEGESEERIEFFTEKFRHLTEAYELLTKH